MPRPRGQRRLGMMPGMRRYKPQGIPAHGLEEIVLSPDQLEAIRLADLEGLYQDQAAERMGVSRATFGRIVAEAHKKIADALVNGKMLKIGDESVAPGAWNLACPACGKVRESVEPVPEGTHCPDCGADGVELWTPGRRGCRGRGHGGPGWGGRQE